MRNGPCVVFYLSFCVCGTAICTGTSIAFCSSDESPPTYNHSSKHAFFKVSPLEVGLSQTLFLFSGVQKCWCGTIATMFSQAPGRDSQDLCCFSSWLHLLDGEDNCMESVPSSTSELLFSNWQSGEICQVMSTGAFTLLCHTFWFSLKGCSSSSFFLVVLPTRCLLDVSCLFGLTLRPPAPVFCCHQDSLTRCSKSTTSCCVESGSYLC